VRCAAGIESPVQRRGAPRESVARRIPALRLHAVPGIESVACAGQWVGRPQSGRDRWHMGRCGAPEGLTVDPVCDHMGPVELWWVRWEGETSGMMMIFFPIVTGPCRRGLGWWSNGCRSWYLGHCFQQGIVQVGLLFKPRCMVALQMVQLLVSRLFDPVLLSILAPLRWVVIHILL
jgi:hypothetical protein